MWNVSKKLGLLLFTKLSPQLSESRGYASFPGHGIIASLRQSIKGEAVIIYRESLITQKMGYHRFSRRVNKMKIKNDIYTSSIDYRRYTKIWISQAIHLIPMYLVKVFHFIYAYLRSYLYRTHGTEEGQK